MSIKSMKPVPQHHKDIFRHLGAKFPPPADVFTYLNNQNKCPIPIAHYGATGNRFYSTIGVCDMTLPIPAGRFEFAAFGKLSWLPNALASSIYWLKGRRVKDWPLVCEDVVKHNTKSTYRHMAYVPSQYSFSPSAKGAVHWLLGVPITDSEISLDFEEALAKSIKAFPKWLTNKAS